MPTSTDQHRAVAELTLRRRREQTLLARKCRENPKLCRVRLEGEADPRESGRCDLAPEDGGDWTSSWRGQRQGHPRTRRQAQRWDLTPEAREVAAVPADATASSGEAFFAVVQAQTAVTAFDVNGASPRAARSSGSLRAQRGEAAAARGAGPRAGDAVCAPRARSPGFQDERATSPRVAPGRRVSGFLRCFHLWRARRVAGEPGVSAKVGTGQGRGLEAATPGRPPHPAALRAGTGPCGALDPSVVLSGADRSGAPYAGGEGRSGDLRRPGRPSAPLQGPAVTGEGRTSGGPAPGRKGVTAASSARPTGERPPPAGSCWLLVP